MSGDEAKPAKEGGPAKLRIGWLPKRDADEFRVGVSVVFGPEVARLRPLLRMHRWLNTVLADYRPILFYDAAEEHPNHARVRYWRMRRENEGWDDLAALDIPRLYWADRPRRPDTLPPAAHRRLDWLFRQTGAEFVLVVPEGWAPDGLDGEIAPLRDEICLRYLEAPARGP